MTINYMSHTCLCVLLTGESKYFTFIGGLLVASYRAVENKNIQPISVYLISIAYALTNITMILSFL